MKTLKKVLAMTLAFATAMTMFISASAFTDDADVQHGEAVGALSSLGIIKGNSDGSFAPEKTVTRGEMAKMIYVLRTGKDDGAVSYSGLSTTFTDIQNSWAQPYIKYCYAQGIISGRSATKFDPDATVTGLEAGKMLLACVGYNAEKAGLTGATWGLAAAALGSEAGIYDDVYQNLTEALNRENAAQQIYNTLDVNTVRFDGDNNEYTDLDYAGKDMKTVGAKYLGLESVTGILTVSGNAALVDADGDTIVANQNVDDDALAIEIDAANSVGTKDEFVDIDTDYSALLGHQVKILYKDETSTTGKKTTKVYGVYSSDENKVVIQTTAGEVDTVAGDANKIEIDGEKYKVDDGVQYYINNAQVATVTTVAKFVEKCTNNGKVIAISNDDNDKIDVIRLYTKEFAQVSSVTSKAIYLAKADCDAKDYYGTTKYVLEDDDAIFYDGIAKDDYVFVDHDYFADKDVVTKADKITGKVTATTDAKMTIGGVAYNYADNTVFATPSLNDEYTIYVDGTYAYAVDGDAASTVDTALITNIDSSYSDMSKGVKAVLLFSDGTTKDVVVNGYNGDTIVKENAGDGQIAFADAVKADALEEGALVEYDTTSSKYQLTLINATYNQHDFTNVATPNYDDDDATINGIEIKDDAVIYVGYYKNADDQTAKDMSYKVVNGKEFATYSQTKVNDATNLFFQKESSGVEYVQLGSCIINGKLSATGSTLYGYVTADPQEIKNADDDTVTSLTVWTTEGEKTIECDDKYDTVVKGSFISFEMPGTVATNVQPYAANTYKAAVKSYNKDTGRISFEANLPTKYEGASINYCKLVADSQIIYISQEDVEGEEGGNIIQATNGGANVIVIQDEDDTNEIAAIFVDINNEIK